MSAHQAINLDILFMSRYITFKYAVTVTRIDLVIILIDLSLIHYSIKKELMIYRNKEIFSSYREYDVVIDM